MFFRVSQKIQKRFPIFKFPAVFVRIQPFLSHSASPDLNLEAYTLSRYDGDHAATGRGSNRMSVAKGNHVIKVHAREDGVRLRNIRFEAGARGTCGFATELLLPDTQTVAFASITSPMARGVLPGAYDQDDFFIWTPDDGSLVAGSAIGGGGWGTAATDHIGADGRCESGSPNCGRAELAFSCSSASVIQFAVNVVATNGHTDSLFLQVDDDDTITWHIPRTEAISSSACADMGGILDASQTVCLPAQCAASDGSCSRQSRLLPNVAELSARLPGNLGERACCEGTVRNYGDELDCFSAGAPPCIFRDPFQWRTSYALFDVDEGPHTFKVITREDGTMTKDVRMTVRGTCGWAYELHLPDTITVTDADLTPPMVIVDDYATVPNGAANVGDGNLELGFICGAADAVQFSFEVSAPNGNDDSFFVQMDDGTVDTFHVPRTGMEGGAIGTGSADDTGHACTHANCETQDVVSCEDLGGIPGAVWSGFRGSKDACCPAACGSCSGVECTDAFAAARAADPTFPALRSGGNPCCPSVIAAQAVTDMGISDRCDANGVCAGENGVGGVVSSWCGDAGVRAPCAMIDEFEWRSFMVEFDAEPGGHSLYVHAREDGTKLRAVHFGQRGTCGWAPQLLLPRTIDATFGRVHSPMVIADDYVQSPDVGTIYSSGRAVCHPAVSNWANSWRPGLDHSANQADDCGYVELAFSCAGPSEITIDLDIAGSQGHNRLSFGIDNDDADPLAPDSVWFTWTFEHTPDPGPNCDDVGGVRSGDICCPAECNHCARCGHLAPGQPVPAWEDAGVCCIGAENRLFRAPFSYETCSFCQGTLGTNRRNTQKRTLRFPFP